MMSSRGFQADAAPRATSQQLRKRLMTEGLRGREDPKTRRAKLENVLHNSIILMDNGLFGKVLELGADLDSKDAQGKTVLMKTAALGDVEKVRMLLKAGADKGIEAGGGKTALDLVGHYNRKEIIELLGGEA